MLNLLSFACLCLRLFFKPGPGFFSLQCIVFTFCSVACLTPPPPRSIAHEHLSCVFNFSSTLVRTWKHSSLCTYEHPLALPRRCGRSEPPPPLSCQRRMWEKCQTTTGFYNSEDENLVHPSSTHVNFWHRAGNSQGWPPSPENPLSCRDMQVDVSNTFHNQILGKCRQTTRQHTSYAKIWLPPR